MAMTEKDVVNQLVQLSAEPLRPVEIEAILQLLNLNNPTYNFIQPPQQQEYYYLVVSTHFADTL